MELFNQEIELFKQEIELLLQFMTFYQKLHYVHMSFLWEQPKRLNNAIYKVKQQELR